jgi:thiopurine S-methyltransferase
LSNEYWLNRWRNGQTGWHQTEVEPALIQWFSGRPKARIFVPLCGKSLDLKWLMDEGHEVVGCELSREACEGFLKENALDFTVSQSGKFTVYRGPSLTLFNGDIFDLVSETVGKIDAIYDRAALIALSANERAKYSNHLMNQVLPATLSPTFEWLQIILTRSPTDLSGPPFSVTFEEVRSLYGGTFKVALVSREKIEMTESAESTTEECVYLLRPGSVVNPRPACK